MLDRRDLLDERPIDAGLPGVWDGAETDCTNESDTVSGVSGVSGGIGAKSFECISPVTLIDEPDRLRAILPDLMAACRLIAQRVPGVQFVVARAPHLDDALFQPAVASGVRLAVAVGAMVLAFVALVALANGMLGWVGGWFGHPELSFGMLVGYVFAPVFYLIGTPDWAEALRAGGFFGSKVVLNEVVGFQQLSEAVGLTPRMTAVVTFALCGFANFSSIAIQMAVTGSLAPNQRPVIARLGLRALVAGGLSNLMSAALAGLFLGL